MSEAISYNQVRYAVHDALGTAFPGIPVSDEEFPQGVDPPRFFVRLLEPGHVRELGRRFRRRYPFAIRYFAAAPTNDDLYDIAEQLTQAVAWITLEGRPLPGLDMRFQIENGVLEFWVAYEMLVWEQPIAAPKMQTLEQEGKIVEA